MIYDITIIGCGVVGGAVARLLGRYDLSVLALEREADICCGTTKANTGIVHSPALVPGGTKKSEYTVRGNLMYDELCRQMGVVLQRTGALILAYSEEDRSVLEKYRKQGMESRKKFGAPSLEYSIIEKDELKRMEPSMGDNVLCALLAPDAGRVIPYELGIALWENAVENGVDLRLNHQVSSVSLRNNPDDSLWEIETEKGNFLSHYVVNAAGHGSNELGMQARFADGLIDKVKGQYLIYDRERDFDVNHILFQVPGKGKGKLGKGILVTKTVYGNLMIGPDARYQEDEDNGTDLESLREVLAGARKSIPGLDEKKIIKTFSGIRPKPESGDFIIESKNRFIHLCGIESPGLTSAPAIGEDVLKLLVHEGLILREKADFNPCRKAIVREILNLPPGELKERINLTEGDENRIICRCEQVPRSRIVDALNRGIPVRTLDGIKRRTRAGQGRCQGAFCAKRVRTLLSNLLNIPESEISQRGEEKMDNRINGADFRR